MVLDLRIPQTKQYEQDVLDTAIAQYLAKELDEAGTEQAIADGWNAITDQVGQGQAARCLCRESWRQAVARRPRSRGAGPPTAAGSPVAATAPGD